MAEILTHLPGL
jgi:hypothetical protein